jgi:Tol biopolymer transport system component
MNSDGSGQRRLVQTRQLGTPLAFTPDSKSVVYAANQDGDYEIHIVTPGKKPVQLAHNKLKLNDGSPDVR